MALAGVITSQTGGRQFNAPNFTRYSMFVGGTNATHHALANYSPLLNGFGRLFMVRTPYAIARMFADGPNSLYSSDSLFMQFKHACEYMNYSVTGFGDKNIDNASTAIQGGFAGRSFQTPTVTKDTTESVTISLYEMVGSPIYTVINDWMNAIGDENSGLATYGGYISGGTSGEGSDMKDKRLYTKDGQDEGIPFNEANHTCEFIYVMHDRSGSQVERAVMLADCYPKGISQSAVLDYTSGEHNNVRYDIQFNCVVYDSPIIRSIANDLLKQYRIVSNHLNFNPELGDAVYGRGNASTFAKSLGSVPVDSASGTNIGNMPVFFDTNEPVTQTISNKDISQAKLAGQSDAYAVPENWDGFDTNG